MEQRTTRWTASLDMAGSTAGLIPAVGVPLLRLLAQESGLRAGLSKALHRKDFHPIDDRGQVVTDVAVALAHGATNVAAATAVLAQAAIVCGPAASSATVWRVFDDLDEPALVRVAAARAVQRRQVWAALAARPEGFPWLAVAGHPWDGWIVLDVDASLIESHSDKQGAEPTFKKHIFGLHPIVVSVANTGEVLTVLLRKGNAGSNTVADHITVLGEAVAQVPARYRKKIIFRADGAGATKDLLGWIKAEAAEHGYTWHYSVGFDVTENVRTAIGQVPADVWAPALTAEGEVRRGAHVAELTGILTVADGWPEDMRTMARTEPLHPRHRKQASNLEKRRGQRFQAVATDLPGRHYPKLDAFHRNHARVETVIKDAKNLGLTRLPSYYLAFNQAWCITATPADACSDYPPTIPSQPTSPTPGRRSGPYPPEPGPRPGETKGPEPAHRGHQGRPGPHPGHRHARTRKPRLTK
ncbi:IS1380 family transposase [Actinoplanes sp. ATCC 53533]|uniref:transposase n=1 Tax=Actinoplanes sp. ATCC 53533 TaxID=1288362 RepID=UPI000F787127|nr:transposase [Actinoplanes sp. ATCC 53533]RSM50584.1 IS1380 family transposase [Actinoplanes sp. ATCC 53533]